MTTGTKIALAVIVLMVGLLVVYYGGGAIFSGDDSLAESGTSSLSVNAGEARGGVSGDTQDAPGAAPDDQRTELADNAAPARPVDPLLQGFADGSAPAPSALATDTPRRQSFIPLQEPRQTELDRPGSRRQETGPAVVLPEASGRALLTSNQPASLSDRSGGGRATGPAPNRDSPAIVSEYTVQAGDTLSSIAEDWFGDASHWDFIAKANPFVDPNRLKVGQKLRMPARDAARSVPPRVEGPVPAAGQYIVQSGDTLVSIARAYYSDPAMWETIFNANKSLIGANPNRLKVGMRLHIPPAPRPAH